MIWPDIVSYLDLGDAFVRGEWKALLGGHWSPLYPSLLGLAVALTTPSPERELAVVKGVDYLLFLFTLGAFDLLMQELIRSTHADEEAAALPGWLLLLTGYAVFLWSAVKWLVVYLDTPDMLVSGLVFLGAALLMRVRRTGSTRMVILLGVVLGLAFLAKTVMLPLGLVFLVALALPAAGRTPGHRVLPALFAFSLVCLPFILALSAQKGRFTFGESGRLNYAWLVNPAVADTHWRGLPPGSGIPAHPTRQILEDPAVFEYATPIGGTYPPWFDPGYWNEGLQPGFDGAQERRLILRNLAFCLRLFGATLVGGVLMAFALGMRPAPTWRALRKTAPVLVPGLVGLAIFVVGTILPVYKLPWGHLQTRYFAPFLVLIFVSILASLRAPQATNTSALVRITAPGCAALIVVLLVGARKPANVPPPSQAPLAAAVRDIGVREGDRLALVGVCPQFHYWARLAKVKIVAEVEARGFWTADEGKQRAAVAAMRSAGARVLVAPTPQPGNKRPKDLEDRGWHRLGATDYYALLLTP